MTDARSAWTDAGDRLNKLGSSLRTQYEKQREGDGEQQRQDVTDALKRLGDAVQDAVDAVGAAVKDPEVKEEVRRVGTSLSSALGATFSGVSGELRSAFDQRKGDVRREAAAGAAPSPDPLLHEPPAAGTPSDRGPDHGE